MRNFRTPYTTCRHQQNKHGMYEESYNLSTVAPSCTIRSSWDDTTAT